MNPAERWRTLEALCHAARERPPHERPAFLANACHGDEALRHDVQSLLDHGEVSDSWRSAPGMQVAPHMSGDAAGASLVGRRIGSYLVGSLLGAGGMGAVYRARDVQLGRDVAIKVLPRAFAGDAERLQRFDQEARVLAALNHPHIAAIYGVEESDGIKALVLELIDGPTLAHLIRHGRIPIEEALSLAGQIAQALKAAHDRGILHRDLKPANIKLSQGGIVKVLDFGLAKIMAGEVGARDVSDAPTVTAGATSEGIVLGTAAYMSPEQARGQAVDQRTDVWAFGCVLYEMLTGRAVFAIGTLSDTLAAVLEREPDWDALPAKTPASIHRLLRRCLRKDARRRLHDIADAQIEIDEATSSAGADSLPARRESVDSRLMGVGLAVAVFGAFALIVWPQWQLVPAEVAPSLTIGPMTRLTWDSGLTTHPSISADGRLIAFASDRGAEGNLDIWVQQTSGGRSIQVTTDPTDDAEPTLSPDGSTVAFRSDRGEGGLYVVPALGGDARLIAPLGRAPRFSPDGRSIAFWVGPWLAARAVGVTRRTYVIPADGGDAAQVAPELESAGDPLWSPDGQSLLVLGRRAARDLDADWWWIPLDGRAAVKTGAYERMRAVGILTPPPGGSNYPYPQAWADSDVLFTATTGSGDARNIWSLSIDRGSGRAAGNPRQLTAGPGLAVSPSVSRDGRLVFSDLIERPQLVGLPLDANGGRASDAPKALRSDAARVGSRASASRDGRFLTFGVMGFAGSEVWLRDLFSGRERQLATLPLASLNPVMSPDGRFVAYTVIANEEGASGGLGAGYFIGAAGGVPKKICDTCQVIGFTDSEHLLIETKERDEIRLINTSTRVQLPIISGGEPDVRVSWDQRWIAFARSDTFYVAPFTPGDSIKHETLAPIVKRMTNADRATGWSPDSRVLYLLLERDGYRCLYAVRIDSKTGRPQGDLFPVHHFHNARWHWGSTSRASAVVTGLFISGQYESTGNIWMTNLIHASR